MPARDRSAGKGPAEPGDGWVCLGAISGVFGVKGEVRIKPFTEQAQAVGGYGPVTLYPGGQVTEITALRAAKDEVIVRLKGVDDRTMAEGLKGKRIYVPRAALPDLDEDEGFYHEDLIGLRVEDEAGTEIGRIKAVHDFGAGDILEVAPAGKGDDGGKSFLVAFTRADVPVVDIAGGRVVIRASEQEEEA